MKRVFLLLLISLAAALTAFSQTAPDAPELTKLLNEFLAGAGRNDAAVHDRFWAEDLIYTRSSGARTNKPDLMRGVRSASAPKATDPVTVYSAEDVKIQQYGSTAVVAFKLVGTTSKSDGTKTVSNHLNTGTFVKRNDKWQVVAWQATAVAPPPQPTSSTTFTKPTEEKPVPVTAASAATAAPSSTASDGKTYIKGPRGGCYYLNASGAKTYVDKKYCP
jgi:hypothetical protein